MRRTYLFGVAGALAVSAVGFATVAGANDSTHGLNQHSATAHSSHHSDGGRGESTTTASHLDQNASPDEPQHLIAIPGDTTVALSWAAPSGTPSAESYRINISTSKGQWSIAADHVTGTTYVATGLTNGAEVWFSVTSEAGTQVGETSRVVTATPMMVSPSATVPGPVMNAHAETIRHEHSPTTLLGWRPPSDTGGAPITSYVIEISTDGGVSWSSLASGVESTWFATPTVSTADYRIAAVNSVGVGAFVTITPHDDDDHDDAPLTPPSMPNGLVHAWSGAPSEPHNRR